MVDLHVITQDSIPSKLVGAHSGYAIRPTLKSEAVSIEDWLFLQGKPTVLGEGIHSIILPDITLTSSNALEYAVLTEFALSLLVASGHPTLLALASFSESACLYAEVLTDTPLETTAIHFTETLNGSVIPQWIERCVTAHKKLADRMRITASRYVHFCRSQDTTNALMDLCISLESLLDSQNEISYRFGVSLAKITGERGQNGVDAAKLLSDLYNVRSKIVHGDPESIKLYNKLAPRIPEIRNLAKRILTIYILFMSEHTREEWKVHLHSCLFA